MRRRTEIGPDLLIGQAVRLPDFQPDRLLAALQQWPVDAVHRHPVDKPLPLLPVPPRHRVAVSAVVEEKPLFGAASLPDLGRRQRQFPLELQRSGRLPVEVDFRLVAQVPVESHRQALGRVAAQDDVSIFRLELKDILAIGDRNQLDRKTVGLPWQYPPDQFASGPERRRHRCVGHGNGRYRRSLLGRTKARQNGTQRQDEDKSGFVHNKSFGDKS